MITIIKTIIALCLTWLSQNTVIFYDNIWLYNDVFEKRYGIVTEKIYEGYTAENDVYIIQFENGNEKEMSGDDLEKNDIVTVWFLGDIPVRMMYDKR